MSRQQNRFSFVFALCAVIAATVSSAETETWTEYFGGALPTSGKQTIAAGHTVVINDAEMQVSKGISELRVPAGAVIQFNTTSAPVFVIEPSNGSSGGTSGTVEKISDSDWTMKKHARRFCGTYVIHAGKVTADATDAFGPRDSLKSSDLYVCKGATLTLSGQSAYFGCVRLHLAGTLELGGNSAFANTVFRFLTLEDDATISVSQKAVVDAFNADNPSYIDLNGHDLTFKGTKVLTLKNGSFKGEGNVIVAAGTSSAPHVLGLDNFSVEASAGDAFTMENHTTLSVAKPMEMTREFALSGDSVCLDGPGCVTFSGGISGTEANVRAFYANAIAGGCASFPGRTVNLGHEPAGGDFSDIDAGALWVGHGATGGLRVVTGSIVSNKLVVGGFNNTRTYQIGNGSICQTGGEVDILGTKSDTNLRNGAAIGWSAHGYYEIAGGATRVLGYLVLGMASPGILAQYGGTFEQVPHPLSPNLLPSLYTSMSANDVDATNIPSVVYVKAGAMKLGSAMLAHGRSAVGVFTLDGPDASVETPARIYFAGNAGSDGRLTINLNGGTLATPYVSFLRNSQMGRLYVNFNGGTFKAMPRTETSQLTTLFGIPNGSVPPVTRVTVGPQGAAIDTSGRSGLSVDVPLAAPTGKVVTAVPFAAETGWTVSPYVEIVDPEGTGAGATAFAEFDSATGTLTGIKVTSGGWNYSSAVAKLYVSKTCVREIACTLGDAATGGSFTKKGAGRLDLKAANTYGGDTVVEGGALRLCVAGALPEGSTVVLRGGSIETAEGVEFPSSIRIDMTDLDPNVQYVLCENYRGETVPDIDDIPNGWKVVLKNGKLILKFVRGLMLILR